jgi:hypothetical protein
METHRGSLKPETYVKGMIKVINTASLSDSEKFLDWEGNSIL